MDKDTLVIIPAFNEALSISRVVASITRLYPDVDVAVINDGSHDGTARLAKEAGASVLSHPFNMGYGVSLQTGYKLAVRNDYRYVVQIDGDGQHDPEGIGELLSVVKSGSADAIAASLRELRAMGVSHCGVRFRTRSCDELCDQIAAFATD